VSPDTAASAEKSKLDQSYVAHANSRPKRLLRNISSDIHSPPLDAAKSNKFREPTCRIDLVLSLEQSHVNQLRHASVHITSPVQYQYFYAYGPEVPFTDNQKRVSLCVKIHRDLPTRSSSTAPVIYLISMYIYMLIYTNLQGSIGPTCSSSTTLTTIVQLPDQHIIASMRSATTTYFY
jgi:hypothetical protein